MAKQYLSYETRQGVKKTTSGFLPNPQLVQKLPVQQTSSPHWGRNMPYRAGTDRLVNREDLQAASR